ncbi:MAG TPA: tRNA pseudouridine(38-40) synthase TruA [Phycisphaerales bacterium]|nr:tRNA pseudouridine(38-40) synthase TruA [Phycisphaerales bacterium]
MPKVRYKITLAYDGTDFHGWQKQEPPAAEHPHLIPSTPADIPEGRVAMRTVQHVVEQALRKICRERVVVEGASRTDSGVHAGGRFPDGTPGGQVAAFTTDPDPSKGVGWPHDRGTAALVRALNSELPRDVLCLAADPVPLDFNPIGDAVRKEYTYTIVSGPTRPLWDRRYVFHTWHELDPARMRAAAAGLVGEHDFAAFAQAGHGRKTTVRTIFACDVEAGGGGAARANPDETRLVIRVSGSGFLYNMVRIIAGTLLEAGRGRIDPAHIPEILASKDRTRAGPTLPPQGLRLEWIRYED